MSSNVDLANISDIPSFSKETSFLLFLVVLYNVIAKIHLVLLQTKRLFSLWQLNGILVCEAGCILENLDNYLAEKGCMMPLDFGAKGSCQIGGNISTNAGGIHLLRYGSLRANVLGLEVVLANGEVIDSLKTLRKDNTGYDLKQIFIGAEGTLGVVTQVSILTPPRLSSKNVAFLSCKIFKDCQKVLKEAKSRLGEILSAFEFMDRHALDMVLNHSETLRDPLPASINSFYLIVETTGSCQSHDKEKLDGFLEACMENDLVADGVVAQDNQQFTSFWQLREGVTESLSKAGAVYKYDLSIPVPHLYSLVEDLQKRLGDLAIVMGYGHLGDGNLHLNISALHYDEKILSLIEPFVYEWTASRKGSISAEHGLGFMKAEAIYYSKAPGLVQWMARFKQMFDCNGILNPYKVLPPSALKDSSSS
ncbi:hypothetical protein L7F22_036992 [Adiantum nelumboides]|nr:hypothetical protein [Adiantum nelumboides]